MHSLHLLPLSKPVFSHSLAIIGSFLNHSIRLHASLPEAQEFCGGVIHEAIKLMRNKPPLSNEGSFGFYCNTQSLQQYLCWAWSVLDIQSLSSFTKNVCVNPVNLIKTELLCKAHHRFRGTAIHNVLVHVITHNLKVAKFSSSFCCSHYSWRYLKKFKFYIYSYVSTETLTFRRRNFLLILAHSVFKMWIIQEPKKVALWNKRHFEEEKTESVQHI